MVTQKTVDLILAELNLDPDGNSTAGIMCLTLSKWARAEIKLGAFSPKTTVQTGELETLPQEQRYQGRNAEMEGEAFVETLATAVMVDEKDREAGEQGTEKGGHRGDKVRSQREFW